MSRPPRLGPYAPLAAGCYRDDAILAAGPDAELLFYRSLAFSADSASDGWFSRRQVQVFGLGLPRLQPRVDALVREGLWEEVDDGYRVRGWLKWNRSAAEIGLSRKRDRDRKRAGFQSESSSLSYRIPDGIGEESVGIPSDSLECSDVSPKSVVESRHDTPRHDTVAIADRADVERLCRHLADRIEANGTKRPTITRAWRNTCRLLLDRDGHSEAQVRAAIDWCQDNEFWRANILSMGALREKYDTMRLQARRTANQSPDEKAAAVLRMAAELGDAS